MISPVKKGIFCPKTTKFGPKLAFLVNLGQAMQAYSMPCCGSVGGCGARAVSRKTPIYFIFIFIFYQENFPHSLRHVRPLLLCPLLRDRGSPLHRVLSSELSIPRFATFLSIVHVIRRRRAHQVIDCVSVFQVYDTRLIRCTPLYHFSKYDRLNCGSKALTPIILHL